MSKSLIVGFGSQILSDDGIGAKITLDLKKCLDNSCFDFQTELTFSLDTIEILRDYSHLILIDAMIGQDKPGTIRYYSMEDSPKSIHLSNFHDIPFKDSILLGRRLGFRITDDIQIITVEIKDNLTFSKQLSNELTPLYHRIIDTISLNIPKNLTARINKHKNLIRHETV